MFIVIVMPKKTWQSEGAFGENFIRYKVDHHENKINPEELPHNTHKVLYTDTKEAADILCAHMAGLYPGQDVYVMDKPVTIYSSATPEVFQKKITEEGVLPF